MHHRDDLSAKHDEKLAKAIYFILSIIAVGVLQSIEVQYKSYYILRSACEAVVSISLLGACYLLTLTTKTPFLQDIRELLLIDVIVNSINFILFLYPDPVPYRMYGDFYFWWRSTLTILSISRVFWFCKSEDGCSYVNWPVFGPIAICEKIIGRHTYVSRPGSMQSALAYSVMIAAPFAGSLILALKIKFALIIFFLVCGAVAFFCARQALVHVKKQRQDAAEILRAEQERAMFVLAEEQVRSAALGALCETREETMALQTSAIESLKAQADELAQRLQVLTPQDEATLQDLHALSPDDAESVRTLIRMKAGGIRYPVERPPDKAAQPKSSSKP